MSRIDWLNWGIALTLSLSLHALFILYKNTHIADIPASISQKNITHISFSSYTPLIEPKPEPAPEPEPVSPPLPILEPTIKPDLESKPEPKPKLKPRPVPRPKPKPKPEKKQKPAPRQKNPAVIQPDPISTANIPEKPDPVSLNQTRQTYLALLLRHIEVHKNYPKSARRRKIEGKIRISFVLLADGSIKNLKINGKRRILKKATRVAINGALPMPRPPGTLSLPMKVEFSMNYFLK